MRKKQKRIISLLLAVLMLFSVLPAGTASVSAAGGVKTRLDGFISSYPSGSRWTGTFDGGSQCYGFGKLVIYNVFGKNSSGGYRGWNYSGVSTSGMNTIGSITSFSASNVQNLLSKAKCGDILQFDYTKQHTMVVYSVDSTGVTVYDCNWDNNCGISKRHSSFGAWSGRNSSKLTLLRSSNYADIDGPDVMHAIDTKYGKNFTAYLKNPSGQTPVYDANHNQVSGRYISGNDPCTIHEVYTDGCCKVSYVTDSGVTRTYYTKYSYFNTHTHSYTYQRVYESEHPHRISERCSCGAWRWTNEYKTLNTCEKCWNITWNVSKSSVDIKVGDSERVNVYISNAVVPEGAKTKYTFDEDIISYTSEKANQGSDFIFKGKKPGTTNFIIEAWDSTYTKKISSYTIKITVDAKKYTVIYDTQGGTPGTFSDITSYDGSFIFTNKRPEKNGYEFLGWNSVKDAQKPLSETLVKPGKEMYASQNLTFYAIYTPITYEVEFLPNGADSGNRVNTQYYQYDSTYALPKNTYSRNGYTFLGWSRDPNAVTAEFADGAVVKNLVSYKTVVGLYAVWQQNHIHNYTNGIITKQPTCTQQGQRTYTCFCGATRTEAVSAKGHTVVIDKAVSATCTQPGHTEGSHCSVCGAIIKQQSSTAPRGHKYDNGKITKPASCEQAGVKTYTCTVCGATKTESISKLSHKYSWKSQSGVLVNSCDRCATEKNRLPFKDLNGYESYGDYIAYTSAFNKFISGTNPPYYTEFSPQKPITRAMFAAILYRMAGNPYDGVNPHTSNPFSDVNENAYYYNAACWALDEGITNQLTFRPNDNVTREQTARFLFNYAVNRGKLGSSNYKNVNLKSYPDYGSVHDWAKEPLQWANYNNMITGTQQGYINPQGATQRIHATRILYGFGKACNIGKFE